MSESTPRASGAPRNRLLFLFELAWVRLRFILLLVATSLVIGHWDTIVNYYDKYTRAGRPADAVIAKTIEYFCPMHPSVVRPVEGSCPICGMPLSRRAKGAPQELPPDVIGRVQLSPERILLAGIRTAEVRLFPLERVLAVPGFVTFDERKLSRIAARAKGRIDRLYVDFVGGEVAAGQPLAEMYSPDLLAAIEEYLAVVRGGGGAAVEAGSRRRLNFLGLDDARIAAYVKAGTAGTTVTIVSPRAGTVVNKYIREGQYVDEGMTLYDVANLTVVWIEAEIYEEDLPFVRVGQKVEARIEAYAGRTYPGTVAFIDPTVDREKRTIRVRFDVVNGDGNLKPGLFATCDLRLPVAETAPFNLAPRPSGAKTSRYACPMHPEVTAAGPGRKCPKCGMELVLTEFEGPAAAKGSAGAAPLVYICPMHAEVTAAEPGKCPKCAPYMDMDLEPKRLVSAGSAEVLVVPERAVIDTGTRKVVYLARDGGIFDAVEAVLGPRTGSAYPVVAGLKAGDIVAAEGAFLVDAESRLHPAPRPDAGPPAAPGQPGNGGRRP